MTIRNRRGAVSDAQERANRLELQVTDGEGGGELPVGAVVNPTDLLAGLQQVQNPCSTVVLLLRLQTGTFHLWLALRVYVQHLLV